MGYIRQKQWYILGKHYGLFYGKYWLKFVGYIWQNYRIYWSIGYIKQKVKDILGKIMGYICQKLWDIYDKNKGVYCVKLWDTLWDVIGNIFK